MNGSASATAVKSPTCKGAPCIRSTLVRPMVRSRNHRRRVIVVIVLTSSSSSSSTPSSSSSVPLSLPSSSVMRPAVSVHGRLNASALILYYAPFSPGNPGEQSHVDKQGFAQSKLRTCGRRRNLLVALPTLAKPPCKGNSLVDPHRKGKAANPRVANRLSM